jgi:hypothetical protein
MSSDRDGLPSNAHRKRTSRFVPISEVDSSVLIDGITLWHSLCGERRYPRRGDVTPRALKTLLRNTLLVRVVEDGKDYEYRIVGDAYVMAHGVSFQSKRWSQIAAQTPGYHAFVKPIYDRVVQEGEPIATRGWIERGGGSTGHIYCEYVFLPLGDEAVDHILVFAVYIRRGGFEHVARSVTGSFAV